MTRSSIRIDPTTIHAGTLLYADLSSTTFFRIILRNPLELIESLRNPFGRLFQFLKNSLTVYENFSKAFWYRYSQPFCLNRLIPLSGKQQIR